MAINPYFANYNHQGTQDFLESITLEMIRMFGIDCWYITRKNTSIDPVLREDDLPIFDQAFQIEMYVKNTESYEGDGAFMSKFGIEMRDQMTLVVAKRAFRDVVSNLQLDNIERPLEGSLVYIPLMGGMFEINYAPKDTVFYQAGNLHIWELKCERFEISNERFKTGVKEIDEYYKDYNYEDVTDINLIADYDPFANNENLQNTSNDFLDFSNFNPLTPKNP